MRSTQSKDLQLFLAVSRFPITSESPSTQPIELSRAGPDVIYTRVRGSHEIHSRVLSWSLRRNGSRLSGRGTPRSVPCRAGKLLIEIHNRSHSNCGRYKSGSFFDAQLRSKPQLEQGCDTGCTGIAGNRY